MSVIVKGLKLENKYLDGYVDVRIHYRDGAIYATIPIGERPYYKRLEVVALPDKHGRLGDLDALIHELNNSHYPGAPYVDAGISIAIGKVCEAPTIVEAEGE